MDLKVYVWTDFYFVYEGLIVISIVFLFYIICVKYNNDSIKKGEEGMELYRSNIFMLLELMLI